MSVKVSSWVWHEARDAEGNEIAGNELVLMLALADVADDNGRCRFVDDETDLTYAALGKKARVSKSTVIRMVASLRTGGLIEHGKGAKGRPNEFRVMVPWAVVSGANLTPNGETLATDSVSSDNDSVSTAIVFGVNDDTRTSLSRIDVTTDVTTSPGSRFAQPLCDVLAVELQRNEVKYSISKKWLADARLLVDTDGRDPREARALMEWACRDSFWRSNILSMPTFRKQYDKLRLARDRDKNARSRAGVVEHGRSVDDELQRRHAGKAIAS